MKVTQHTGLAALLTLLTLALGLGHALGGAQDEPSARLEGVTVALVRHAEKAAEPADDPPLTAEGARRAVELARVLGAAEVTHLFSTPLERTRQTLAPLAAARGLEVADYEPRDLRGLAQRLQDLPPGSFAVVSGHSNTTPALYELLGGEARGLEDSPYGKLLAHDAYDRLFLVTLAAEAKGEVTPRAAFELRYGAE